MDPTQINWLDALRNDGPMAVLFLLFVAALVWYGPRLIKAHLESVESNKKTNERLTTCYETLTESQTLNGNGHTKTRRALSHIVDAAHDATTCQDVREHLSKAKRELEL